MVERQEIKNNKKQKRKKETLEICSNQREKLSYLSTPPLGQDITQGQFLSGV